GDLDGGTRDPWDRRLRVAEGLRHRREAGRVLGGAAGGASRPREAGQGPRDARGADRAEDKALLV
ncbi:MAG: hypothetical protein AVDCRST_MAG25-1632, partial [uncultured Rubrobacteraceae bacterium]